MVGLVCVGVGTCVRVLLCLCCIHPLLAAPAREPCHLPYLTNPCTHADPAGHGGHGTVFRGRWRGLTVAVKRLKLAHVAGPQVRGWCTVIVSMVGPMDVVGSGCSSSYD